MWICLEGGVAGEVIFPFMFVGVTVGVEGGGGKGLVSEWKLCFLLKQKRQLD